MDAQRDIDTAITSSTVGDIAADAELEAELEALFQNMDVTTTEEVQVEAEVTREKKGGTVPVADKTLQGPELRRKESETETMRPPAAASVAETKVAFMSTVPVGPALTMASTAAVGITTSSMKAAAVTKMTSKQGGPATTPASTSASTSSTQMTPGKAPKPTSGKNSATSLLSNTGTTTSAQQGVRTPNTLKSSMAAKNRTSLQSPLS
jgi:hypothetical protein